ncbi:MAG: glycerate kinase, partial [Acetanaerobacterium sp.]
MKKFVLIPDSFKGTMSSQIICDIMARQIRDHYPDADIRPIPVADGGEGSVDCFLAALGGQRIELPVAAPYFEQMTAFYGLLDGGTTAVVEMAACAGLPLVDGRKDPTKTTTYGVGQLILDAARRGAKKIIVGLGGSATNDGGCGAAAAAGVRFYDEADTEFVPVGGTLHQIARIDMTGRAPVLDGVEIVAMCDIDNPMFGPAGAAEVFGPQKGANPDTVRLLDAGVAHLADVIKRDLGKDIALVPGTGAAGAMGAGVLAFFGAALQMGIETVLDTVHFEQAAKNADMVFTGEGK